jgi:pimeloyl-ACP methyl ester carboxylesterase
VPTLRRPDGAELHWEQRGAGPLVVFCHPCFSLPSAFQGLTDELTKDHRTVVYDPRGTGASSRTGPWEIPTDAEDLIALLEEIGEPAVLVSFADGLHRSVQVGAERPDHVRAVICPGVAAFGPRASYPDLDDGLASSPAVVGALLQLLETDYRSGLRTVVEGGNPQMSEREIQERIDAVIEHVPAEVTLSRLRSWIGYDSRREARALGDRLWVLAFPGNVWFPLELLDALRADAPEARVEHVADGAVSRPDLTAEIVRRVTHC